MQTELARLPSAYRFPSLSELEPPKLVAVPDSVMHFAANSAGLSLPH